MASIGQESFTTAVRAQGLALTLQQLRDATGGNVAVLAQVVGGLKNAEDALAATGKQTSRALALWEALKKSFRERFASGVERILGGGLKVAETVGLVATEQQAVINNSGRAFLQSVLANQTKLLAAENQTIQRSADETKTIFQREINALESRASQARSSLDAVTKSRPTIDKALQFESDERRKLISIEQQIARVRREEQTPEGLQELLKLNDQRLTSEVAIRKARQLSPSEALNARISGEPVRVDVSDLLRRNAAEELRIKQQLAGVEGQRVTANQALADAQKRANEIDLSKQPGFTPQERGQAAVAALDREKAKIAELGGSLEAVQRKRQEIIDAANNQIRSQDIENLKLKTTQSQITTVQELTSQLATQFLQLNADRLNRNLDEASQRLATLRAQAAAEVQGFGFGFARGGIVPGSGTGDTVHTMLTPGEMVINKHSTELFYPLLRAINAGRVQHLAQGGIVNNQSNQFGDIQLGAGTTKATARELVGMIKRELRKTRDRF